jgi:tetratricopeptide (TPR) repeat protein
MNRSVLSCLVALLAVIISSPTVTAQDYSHYQGRKVMIIKWDTEARNDTTVVRKLNLGYVNEVTKINGTRLWFNQMVGGWVEVEDVVLYEQAMEHFNQLVQHNPSAANYINRASASKAMGNYDQAIADYDQVILLATKVAQAFNSRGYAWHSVGAHDKAIAEFDNSIRFDPTNANAYFNRGDAWATLGKYDKAIYDYNSAIRLDPKGVQTYIHRGIAWETIGKYAEAIADYNSAIELDPKSNLACNNAAWILATCAEEQHRDGMRAVELATKACQISGFKAWNQLDTLAAAYAESGDFAKAVEWIAKAKELAPANQHSYCDKLMAAYQAKKPYRMEPDN